MSLIEHMIKAGWTRSFSCGQENDLISRQAAIDDENTKGAAK